MVRITGSVKDENALRSPSGELLSSVVLRSNGKSAKRMSGTESNAPTRNEPSASSTPRKDRLLSRDDPDGEGLSVVGFESLSLSNMRFCAAPRESVKSQEPICRVKPAPRQKCTAKSRKRDGFQDYSMRPNCSPPSGRLCLHQSGAELRPPVSSQIRTPCVSRSSKLPTINVTPATIIG